ncbi:MAG: SprT family zinc-dependent metalloprotease [Pseudomonadota bacterium]
MTTLTFPGDPPVDIQLRRSQRARRLSLRVSHVRGTVTMTMPLRVAEAEARAFASEKLDWIRGHLENVVPSTLAEPGAMIPVEGVLREIRLGSSGKITLEPDAITVPRRVRSVPARVGAFLKELARERLTAASDQYATELRRTYCSMALRDTRSRWGSCSTQGRLMYSWRLILAPPEVLRYVAAHEVAHLAEMNHSRRFWAHVHTLFPGYETQRAWLRRNGAELHRYQFRA